jgi:regulatory protein
MVITALQKKNSKVIVFFDDISFCTLDYRVALNYGLRSNDSINEEKKEQLITESIYLSTRDSAFRSLSRRSHSVYELRTKLIRKGWQKEIIQRVLDDLVDKNFLDDEKFAVAYIDERSKKKVGINKIKAELMKRGIDRKISDSLLINLDSNSFFESALTLADKKNRQLKERGFENRKIRTKLYSFLHSRGFESEFIIRIINEVASEND